MRFSDGHMVYLAPKRRESLLVDGAGGHAPISVPGAHLEALEALALGLGTPEHVASLPAQARAYCTADTGVDPVLYERLAAHDTGQAWMHASEKQGLLEAHRAWLAQQQWLGRNFATTRFTAASALRLAAQMGPAPQRVLLIDDDTGLAEACARYGHEVTVLVRSAARARLMVQGAAKHGLQLRVVRGDVLAPLEFAHAAFDVAVVDRLVSHGRGWLACQRAAAVLTAEGRLCMLAHQDERAVVSDFLARVPLQIARRTFEVGMRLSGTTALDGWVDAWWCTPVSEGQWLFPDISIDAAMAAVHEPPALAHFCASYDVALTDDVLDQVWAVLGQAKPWATVAHHVHASEGSTRGQRVLARGGVLTYGRSGVSWRFDASGYTPRMHAQLTAVLAAYAPQGTHAVPFQRTAAVRASTA